MSDVIAVFDVSNVVVGAVVVVPVALDMPVWLLLLEAVVVVVVKMSDWLLLFGQPPIMSYLFPLRMPTMLLLHMYPFCLTTSLLYLDLCFTFYFMICQDSLTP